MTFNKTLAVAAAFALGGVAIAQAGVAAPAVPAAPAMPSASAGGGANTGASATRPSRAGTTGSRVGVDAGMGASTAAPPADGHDDPAVSRLPGVTPGAGVNTSPVGTTTRSPGAVTDGGAPTGRDAERERK